MATKPISSRRIKPSWVLLVGLLPSVAGCAAAEPHATNHPLPRVTLSGDGRGFVTAAGKPFVPFGVNYYRPGTGWAPQLWKTFDADAVARDFARMKTIGVNCVRVFLTFGSFYSEPGRLDPGGVAKFDRFLALAEAQGIYVHPTGPDHWEGLPQWAQTDRYADENVLAALERFWSLFAAKYRGRAVIFAYDLLNEPQVGWESPTLQAKWNEWLKQKYTSSGNLAKAWARPLPPPGWGAVEAPQPQAAAGSAELLDYQLFREQIAATWTRRQTVALKAADPQALVTVGLIQWSVPALLPGVKDYSAFRPERQAKFLDFLEIHFYPFDDGVFTYRNAEEEDRNLSYLHSVVAEVAKAGKPVVLAEFGWYGGGKPRFDGGRHTAASEQQQARWCRRAVETTTGLACGWLNWGFYDHPEATDVSELTGLLTAKGELKAWGREFQLLSDRIGRPASKPAQAVFMPDLDWNRCLTDPAAGQRWRRDYYRRFTASQSLPRE